MPNDPSRLWSAVTPFGDAHSVTERARQLETAGLRGIFAPQLYGPPWTTLATCIPETERLELASGIALAFARSPFETAMAAMDMDRLSGGRFVLGLGPSVRSWSEGFFGMPYGKPVEHLREVIGLIDVIVARSHTGKLGVLEGRYHSHDFTDLVPLAEPVRMKIPIWVAAARKPLIRLAAEAADGLIGHPIWSVRWAVDEAMPTLRAALAEAGRDREVFEVNLWFWVAINDDRRQAIQDAKGTVAFYAGIPQYDSYFAAHGFAREAKLCQEATQAGDLLGSMAAITDEMAATFVVCGSADEVRAQLAPVWDVADSLCLVPPLGGITQDEQAAYRGAIDETFYS